MPSRNRTELKRSLDDASDHDQIPKLPRLPSPHGLLLHQMLPVRRTRAMRPAHDLTPVRHPQHPERRPPKKTKYSFSSGS
ncbi:unnamed protein product [Boreogadus saida]